MKLKNDLVLRQVADTWVVLPMSRESLNFNGMLTLNESGAMLWNLLQQTEDEASLVNAMLDEYDVPRDQLQADVDEFLKKLSDAGCIEN